MYRIWMAVGVLACWLALTGQLGWKRWLAALGTALLAGAFGLAAAKLSYVLLLINSTVAVDGVYALFWPDADTFCMFGGMAGAVLGAWTGAKAFRIRSLKMLDCFMPAIALLLAVLRAGEKELGTIGVGGFVQAESLLARYPFAVTNAYGEHLYAVFYLEALLALICAVFMMFAGKKWPEGIKTEIGLFLLALPQIYCESLRARCMKWGFVRIEQLLCGLLVLGLIAFACSKTNGKLRFLPVVWTVLCIAGVGLLEYALDKSGIPVWLCYVMMIGDLLVMAAIEWNTVKKRIA